MADDKNAKFSFKKTLLFLTIFSVFVIPDKLAIARSVYFSFSLLVFLDIKDLKLNKDFLGFLFWRYFILLLALISMLWSPFINNALRDLLPLLQTTAVSLAIILYVDTKEKLDFVFQSIILSSLLLISRIIFSIPFDSLNLVRIGYYLGLNSNRLGMNLAYAVIFVLFLKRKSKKYLFLFMLLSVFLLLTGSKKALIMLLLTYLLFMFLNRKNMKKLAGFFIYAPVFLGLLYYLIMKIPVFFNLIGYRFSKMLNVFTGSTLDASTTTRINLINEAFALMKERPLIGFGLDNFRRLSVYSTYAHNNYMELGVSLGAVGIIIYYSLPLYVFFTSLKRWSEGNDEFALIIAIILNIVITDFGNVSYKSSDTQIMLALSFAYMGVLVKQNNSLFRKHGVVK